MFGEIGSLVEKLFLGVILLQKIARSLRKREIWNFFIFHNFSACQSESIGMLIVKIGRTVETFLGIFFTKIPRLLPKDEFWTIAEVFVCFGLTS
jgi:hypothetical protein